MKAIYVHELRILGPEDRPTLVNLFLHPSTGDDDDDSKYVCLNLLLTISEKYPLHSPGISIKNPRGLSDAHVVSIQENLLALAKEKIGSPMLYDLIEYAKECLSDNNIPSCPCVICLEHFEHKEKFVKTECYHYFHAVCLSNYVDHFLSVNEEDKTIVCPMCRLEIEYNKNESEIEEDNNFGEGIFVYKPNEDQLRAQAERQRIFEYQKSKGGIIDLEEERNKFLIGIKDRKENENKSRDSQSHQMPLKSVVNLGPSQERHDPNIDGNQACGKKVERNKPQSKNDVKKKEGNNWKSSARDSTAEGQSEAGTCDAESQKRTGDKRTRERNDSRPKRSHEKHRESREQPGEDRKCFKQMEMPQKEKDLNSSKDNVDNSLIQDEMNSGTKERKSKDCNLSSGNRPTNEISSEKEESCLSLDATDGEKKEKCSLQSTQLKLSSFPTSKSIKSRNLEPKKERNRSSDSNSMLYSSTSKQVTSKQHERKAREKNESERKSKGGRTRTPRRAREESKDSKPVDEKKYPKFYRSVTSGTNRDEWTKRKAQSIKRKDAHISENNNKSEKTSDRNFPEKVGKISPNVTDKVLKSDEGVKVSEHSLRTPPPAFESSQSTVVVKGFEKEQKSQLKKTPQTTFGELSIASDAQRRPPPGFENVKPSV